MLRDVYLHLEDDEFGQAGGMYREAFDDAARDRFLVTITEHVGEITSLAIRDWAVQSWINVYTGLGIQLAAALRPLHSPCPVDEERGYPSSAASDWALETVDASDPGFARSYGGALDGSARHLTSWT